MSPAEADETLAAVMRAAVALRADSSIPHIVLRHLGLMVVPKWDQHDFQGYYVARVVGEF